MRVNVVIPVIASILILGSVVGVSFDNAFAGAPLPPEKVRICHFGEDGWKPLEINENALLMHIQNHFDSNNLFDHEIAFDESEDGDCFALNQQNSLHISKFYDVNANGEKDVEEPFIANWLVEVAEFDGDTDVILTSFTTLTTAWFDDIEGDVLVSEAQEENWFPTNQEVPPILITVFDSDATVTVASNTRVTIDGETIVLFGNVCLGETEEDVHSKGFWGNKHGQALIDGGDLVDLNTLNLVEDDGSPAFFGNSNSVKTWLKDSRAKNMAYMLSAQLAAMQLNVNHDSDIGDLIVYVPGVDENTNFLTIQELMDAADEELEDDPDTTSPSDERDHQELKKDALDDANNNEPIFVQPDICDPFEEEILLP